MAMPKVHAEKQLPGGRTIAMCWQTKPGTMTSANEAAVDCKKCLKALEFNRVEAAEWAARHPNPEGGAQ